MSAHYISRPMSDMLIEHIDGQLVEVAMHNSHRTFVMMALLKRGFICGHGPSPRPTHTVITEAGRMALAKVLAAYADALVRAGYRVQERVPFVPEDDLTEAEKAIS